MRVGFDGSCVPATSWALILYGLRRVYGDVGEFGTASQIFQVVAPETGLGFVMDGSGRFGTSGRILQSRPTREARLRDAYSGASYRSASSNWNVDAGSKFH